MIGTIQQANKSKSGKTLSIQINNVWYTSKNWELEQAVNRRVIFEPSTQTFPDGASIQWLNDYVFEDASGTPSARAMDDLTARQQVPLNQAQHIPVNKDSLIGALALTKSFSGEPEAIWNAFVYFYHKMESFDPNV